MRRRHSVIGFVGGLFILVGLTAWSQAASGIDAVVIFATNSVHVDVNTEVLSGDIVVNDFSDGPMLDLGFELRIKRSAAIAGSIKADSIRLDKGVTIAGAIECNDGAGVTCSGLLLPVFGPEELPEARTPVLGANAQDVAVGPGETVMLEAGAYLDITIDNGGTLVFTGGVYNVGSILPVATSGGRCAFSPCRSVEFLAPSELRILGLFDIGSDAFVGPGSGSTAMASSIILYVAGTNLVPEDPASDPPAARVGKDSTVEANIWAPNGTLQLKRNVTATGAFWGRDVDIDRDGQIRLASFFNPPPTADAQNVVTDGTNPVDITLTGSDPDNEILEFSIMSGPSHGTLSGLFQVPPSSAAVTYTASQTGDLQDEFTFRVTDPNGGFDEAVVSINPVDTPPPPPTPSNTVIGEVASVEAVTDADQTIILVGFADVADPGAVGDLEFSIVSGPSLGTLSGLTQASPTSASVTYSAPSDSGLDSFDFQVCGDLNDDGDTADAGECDTARVTIAVEAFAPPAPPVPPTAANLTVATEEDTPVEINLSDGTGSGAGGPRKLQKRSVLQGGPNLTVTAFSAPACALLGEIVGDRIQVTVTNTGPAVIPAGTAAAIGFYISTDSIITTDDVLLTGGRENLLSEAPGGLLVGESIQDFLVTGASINTGSPTGSVYIGVLADEFDVLDEDNETDNTAFLPIEIKTANEQCPPPAQPDLVVSNLTHTPLEPLGFGNVDFNAVVENQGDADAAASTLCFAIGALGESCDSAAALFNVSLLAPGETASFQRSADVAVGTYQNTAVADVDDDVAESDENNNTAVDSYVVAASGIRLTATIEALPTEGKVFGITLASNGVAVEITTVPTTLVNTMVSYTPNPLPSGADEVSDVFEYTLFDTSTGLTSSRARIDLIITEVFDSCLENGREVGCTPGR